MHTGLPAAELHAAIQQLHISGRSRDKESVEGMTDADDKPLSRAGSMRGGVSRSHSRQRTSISDEQISKLLTLSNSLLAGRGKFEKNRLFARKTAPLCSHASAHLEYGWNQWGRRDESDEPVLG